MNTCINEQLELTLQPLRQQFRDGVLLLIKSEGASEKVRSELQSWAHSHGFSLLASWCRHLLGKVETKTACILLECFGMAFRGDFVGTIGRDLLTVPLNSSEVALRNAAINVLGRWLEHDEDGMWIKMAEGRLAREKAGCSVDLYKKLWNLVSWFHEEA